MKDKLKVHPSKYNEFGDTIENDGMDLRDYFANSAMIGLIANEQNFDYLREQTALLIARDSYLLADAMLKQREL